MKTCVFTFGRMNPPHIGHKKVIDCILENSKKLNADHFIFLSHSQDSNENPLSIYEKANFTRLMFPGVKFMTDENIRTPINALEYLGENGYKNVLMVVGEDRIEPFKLFEEYTADMGIKSFKVISAGNRDPKSEGIEGVSSSLLRKHVTEDNFQEFSEHYSQFNPSIAKLLFSSLQKKMNN